MTDQLLERTVAMFTEDDRSLCETVLAGLRKAGHPDNLISEAIVRAECSNARSPRLLIAIVSRLASQAGAPEGKAKSQRREFQAGQRGEPIPPDQFQEFVQQAREALKGGS